MKENMILTAVDPVCNAVSKYCMLIETREYIDDNYDCINLEMCCYLALFFKPHLGQGKHQLIVATTITAITPLC